MDYSPEVVEKAIQISGILGGELDQYLPIVNNNKN